MSKKIDLGLFMRLMRLSAPTRNDLLEYVGQAPVLTEDLVSLAERTCAATQTDTSETHKTQNTPA
jgi:hypothetical protein